MTRQEERVQYAMSFQGKGMENEELKDIIRLAVLDGATWADKHPALTWEDMMHIHKHIKDAMNYHLYELQNGIEGQRKVYQNILERFLKEKKED